MMDKGSCVNIISKSVVERMGLKIESHLQSYINWDDKSFYSVVQHYLMPIKFLSYSSRIWCNGLRMVVANILLGRLWLFDQNVKSYGKYNTYTFMFHGKKIVLTSSSPKRVPLNIKIMC